MSSYSVALRAKNLVVIGHLEGKLFASPHN